MSHVGTADLSIPYGLCLLSRLEQANTAAWVHPPAPCGSEHKVFEDTYVAELDHQRRSGIWLFPIPTPRPFYPSFILLLFLLLLLFIFLLLLLLLRVFLQVLGLQLVQVFKSSSLRPEFSSFLLSYPKLYRSLLLELDV